MENHELDGHELNGHERQPEGAIRFASLDDGGEVLAYPHATAEGQVALTLAHELDGELEVFMEPTTAEDLALALARASDDARLELDLKEDDEEDES